MQLTPDQFQQILDNIGLKQTETAKILGVSQAALSNYKRGMLPTKNQSTKIINNYEAFMSHTGDETAKPAFIEETQVRDTASGRIVKKDSVASYLVGITDDNRTDAEIVAKTKRAFMITDRITSQMGVSSNAVRALIVSGDAGVGKSFSIINPIARTNETHPDMNLQIVKGSASPYGIYTTLFNAKDGGVIIFDDCDSALLEEESLNLFKAALDTTDKRVISWRKKASWVYPSVDNDDEMDSEGRYPDSFEFGGSVIFITNVDFHEKATSDTKMSPHFQALISRSMYVDLSLKTNREKILWMKEIFMKHMAPNHGISTDEADTIMKFVTDNASRMIDLSLRLMTHIVDIYKSDNEMWRDIIEVTKMR